MKKMFAVSTILLLSACTQYKWVKPGNSDLDMHKQLTSCQAKALVDLPPDNVVYDSRSTGYEEERSRRGGKNKDKGRVYETYSANTVNNISDANQQQRDILVRDCMYSRGWNEIVISS